MKKNFLIGAGLVILILGGLAFLARPNQNKTINTQASASAAAVISEEASFDFGQISMAAGPVTHNFTVKNTHTEPVSIQKLYTSCMCTSARLMVNGKTVGPYGMPGHGFIPSIKESLDPNETGVVEVVFDPAAHGPAGIGPIHRIVTLEYTAGNALDLHVTATVTP